MTYYGITVEDGMHRVYATDNGIQKRLVGPRWASVRQAMRYADLQAELDRSISPLRHPVTRSGDDTTLPAAGELREGTPRRRSGSPDLSPQVAGTHPRTASGLG